MSSRAVLPLVALAALGLVTGCEKPSPYVTMTAHGVVVKARASKYCRTSSKCVADGKAATIDVRSGDILGIDVPRSLADDGWTVEGILPESHDHYRSITIPASTQPQAGIPLVIRRAGTTGSGEWHFTINIK